MPSKTFHLDGNAGILMIGNYGINLDAVNNPNNYLTQLNFHSGLEYIQIKGYVSKTSASFPALTRDVVYWDDGSKCDFGCYITTACVEYKGLEDDCFILETLRKFRDEYMLTTEVGKALVEEYYKTAPAIVVKIKQSKHARDIFEDIFQNYLSKAVSLIMCNKYPEAQSLYTEMYNKFNNLEIE